MPARVRGTPGGRPTWGDTANPPGVGPQTWQGASQRPAIAFNALRAHFRVAWSGSHSAACLSAWWATGVQGASLASVSAASSRTSSSQSRRRVYARASTTSGWQCQSTLRSACAASSRFRQLGHVCIRVICVRTAACRTPQTSQQPGLGASCPCIPRNACARTITPPNVLEIMIQSPEIPRQLTNPG